MEYLYNTQYTHPICQGIQMIIPTRFGSVVWPSGSWLVIHIPTGRRQMVLDAEWIQLQQGYGAAVVRKSYGV